MFLSLFLYTVMCTLVFVSLFLVLYWGGAYGGVGFAEGGIQVCNGVDY